MDKCLIFAGTTEGRIIAEQLSNSGIFCDVCVATEYGEQVLTENENMNIMTGRKTSLDIGELIRQGSYNLIIDATHPFAYEISQHIKNNALENGIVLFRINRDIDLKENQICDYVDSIQECVSKLKDTEGNILLTTGSKNLDEFCAEEELKKRLIVRVLPSKESLEICYKNDLKGSQIIAMQGPFDLEMNEALMKQYNIKTLVTKESGKTGGVDEKISACEKLGIPCLVIRNSSQTEVSKSDKLYFEFGTLSDLFDKTEELLNASLQAVKTENNNRTSSVKITLAGIGMGSKNTLTMEVKEAIETSDYVFGAARMVEIVPEGIPAYPFYQAKDIIPVIEDMIKGKEGDKHVTILFSGDTGFFSGCAKMVSAVHELGISDVEVLPGISSIAYLSSKAGLSWQDAYIISAHGTDLDSWRAKLNHALLTEKKIFLLTSDYRDLKEIGKTVFYLSRKLILGDSTWSREENPSDLHGEEECLKKYTRFYVGNHLSYSEEEILEMDYVDLLKVQKKGLYVCMIENELPSVCKESLNECKIDSGVMRYLAPGTEDEAFIRDKVPMTKEEIRQLSVCKLHLRKDSVVYDIGSGTGSVAVEIAKLSPDISVYALECDSTAVRLIGENIEKFRTPQIHVLETMAPKGLENLPTPTHAFIGGSKGNLREILSALYEKNPSMRVVMNAVSLETVVAFQEVLKEFPVTNLDISQVSVSKAKQLGNYHLMQANNPVFIYAFDFIKG